MNQLKVSRVKVLQGLIVVALVLPPLIAFVFVWRQHHRIEQNLADVEPRYARLRGMLLKESEILAQVKQMNAEIERIVYAVDQDASQAGNDAQQKIRTFFTDSKLEVISIQVLPAKEDGPFDKINIELRVEGELAGIQNALALLEVQSPLILTNEVSLQTIGAVKPASIQRLAGQFSFSILRRRA